MNKMITLTAITFFGASLVVGGLNAAANPALAGGQAAPGDVPVHVEQPNPAQDAAGVASGSESSSEEEVGAAPQGHPNARQRFQRGVRRVVAANRWGAAFRHPAAPAVRQETAEEARVRIQHRATIAIQEARERRETAATIAAEEAAAAKAIIDREAAAARRIERAELKERIAKANAKKSMWCGRVRKCAAAGATVITGAAAGATYGALKVVEHCLKESDAGLCYDNRGYVVASALEQSGAGAKFGAAAGAVLVGSLAALALGRWAVGAAYNKMLTACGCQVSDTISESSDDDDASEASTSSEE